MPEPITPSPDEGKPAVDPIDDTQPQAPANEPPTPEPNAEVAALRAELEQVKKDYGASSREAQLLIEQIKQKDAQIEQLTKPHDPTDAELKAAYPEWDSMMPSEQRLARENLALKRSVANTQQTTAELQAEIRWGKDLKSLVKKDEFKDHADRLKGDDFEDYVFKPHHKGVALDVLARAFLFGSTPAAPAQPATTPPAPTAARGTPHSNPPAAKKKLTIEEGAALRKTNFEEWRRQVAAGNIETDID